MMKQYLKLIRVLQWMKNGFLFVPLIFSRHLFEGNFLTESLIGFIAFCFTSSIVYIMNDIVDAEADRQHPVKKNRPIASGKISVINAIIVAITLSVFVAILLSTTNQRFILATIFYFVLNLFYTFSFKHIVLLDIFSIAAGFMIRVAAGAFVITVELSSWLILTTMFISLFLAVLKRRSELQIVANENQKTTRKVLQQYSLSYLDQVTTIAATGVVVCYALYTVSARTVSVFNTEKLIYTTPFVVFGIFRYMYLVLQNQKGENTSEDLLHDPSMIVNIFLYILATVLIVYKIF